MPEMTHISLYGSPAADVCHWSLLFVFVNQRVSFLKTTRVYNLRESLKVQLEIISLQ